MSEGLRRIPRQARAASTVDTILTAALQLLETVGVEQLTTNHVADRAGVSIGTVYQYFGDKQEILSPWPSAAPPPCETASPRC